MLSNVTCRGLERADAVERGVARRDGLPDGGPQLVGGRLEFRHGHHGFEFSGAILKGLQIGKRPDLARKAR